MADEKLIDRARDELFSHINRCGVLQAAEEDQRHWMDETIDYIGERYPDLSEANLRDLHTVGLRFCRPAIRNGTPAVQEETEEAEAVTTAPAAVKSEAATEDAPEAVEEEVLEEVGVGATEEAGAA